MNLNENAYTSDNSANSGGGVFNDFLSTVRMSGSSRMSGNKAAYTGGAIYSTGRVTIANVSPSAGSLISNNSAVYGGGIYNGYSGTVYLYGGSIDHNTATATAPSGGGIYNWGWIYGDIGIVHDNTPDQIVNAWE